MIKNTLLSLALLANGPAMKASVVSVEQQQCDWKITVKAEDNIYNNDLKINVDGYVSNSSVDVHSFPKLSQLSNIEKEYDSRSSIYACKTKSLIMKPDEEHRRCSESMEYSFPDDKTIIIYLKHEHQTNEYDPLFGKRSIRLETENRLWETVVDFSEKYPADIKDKIKLDDKKYADYIDSDGSIYFDGFNHPDLLGPTHGYVRFDELRVKPGARYRVRFRYKILKDSNGFFNYKLLQYEQHPNYWRSGETKAANLKITGEWIDFHDVVRVGPDTNVIAIEFAFKDSDIGDAWVKDLTFEPISGFRLTNP